MSQPDLRRVGEVRASQVMYSFGVGAIVDLPNGSAIVRGLDVWPPRRPGEDVVEERLLALVRSRLGAQVEGLRLPPTPADGGDWFNDPLGEDARIGLPVEPFPRWVRCPACRLLAPLDFGVFGFKHDPYRPDRTKWIHENCPERDKPTVIPARFVVACEGGHLDDFPWREFVHGGPTTCRGPFELIETGMSSEVADVYAGCRGCGARQPMVNAFGERGKAHLARCTGRHPHLGRDYRVACDRQPKAMLSGSNALWFPVTATAIALPSGTEGLARLVEKAWAILEHGASVEILGALLKTHPALTALARHPIEDVWGAVQDHRSAKSRGTMDARSLRPPEWALFLDPDSAPESDEFKLVSAGVPRDFEEVLESVVQVTRLRMVKALTNFTRLVSPGNYDDGDSLPSDNRAPLASVEPTWVPALEVRGEGIFLQFKEDAIAEWLERPEVVERASRFHLAHTSARRARRIIPAGGDDPGARYVLLHTLSHLLLRQFSLECGYSSASLSERIYSAAPADDDGPMAGILLYTASNDSEGTLGGLVDLGRPQNLRQHLAAALERAALCAGDPLCAEHEPRADANPTLHGAACHACCFVSETSCERGNRYLDRSLVAETLRGAGGAFFKPLIEG